jgi:rubredoxin
MFRARLYPKENKMSDDGFKQYMCVICGYIYNEETGDEEHGLAPGTKWDDIPLSWVCPDCDATKEDFEMIEI